MKNSQEPNDIKTTESPIIPKDKQDEPKELSSNPKDINNLNSGISNLNINSEQSNQPKKEMPIVNKDSESKNKLDLEDNTNSIKNIEPLEKENSNLSALDEKNFNNNKTKTPLKPQSSPMNFQLKKNANFQMKARKNTFTESDYYESSRYNSIKMKSPIYSYFDQSQKYLSANYNGDNYFNYSENKNEKKNLEQEDNPKKIKNDENSENIPGSVQIKTDKSIEHESESMNYNDYNFFMSPDNHNSSLASAGINNNLPTNKFSRKSSQAATPSYKRVNSQNNFVNAGGVGESDNIDFNIDIPMNESNDEYSNNFINMNNNNNINSDENKFNNEIVPNPQSPFTISMIKMIIL